MAESGLSIGYADLRQKVGYFLGYGQAVSNWSGNATKAAHVEDSVQSGVRGVYYPAAVDQSMLGYEWSWLRPTTELAIYAAYATGTVTIASGVVTLDSGTFPSWAAAAELTIGIIEYPVDTRDSDTQVTLVDTSIDADAETSYSLAQADYDLPDAFGRLVGEFQFPIDENRRPIRIISVGLLLAKRASRKLYGPPRYAATRYKTSDGSAGQRQEVLFYPETDEDFDLPYEYEAYQAALSDDYPYPLGGMQVAELYIASCLSVAEQRINDEVGIHTQQYRALLLDASKSQLITLPCSNRSITNYIYRVSSLMSNKSDGISSN